MDAARVRPRASLVDDDHRACWPSRRCSSRGPERGRATTRTAGSCGAIRRCMARSTSAAHRPGSRCPICSRCPSRCPATTQLWLWMISATAISLAGAIFAGRIAYRLSTTNRAAYAADRRGADCRGCGARARGLHALHPQRAVRPDDRHLLPGGDRLPPARTPPAGLLARRARRARPPRGVAVSRRSTRSGPGCKRAVDALAAGRRRAVVAFMWFGIPWITNDRPLVSEQLALGSPRELRQNQVTGTFGRFTELEYLAGLAGGAVRGRRRGIRRDRLVLALPPDCVGWVIVEIAFALHGWPALSRYMFEAAGVGAVLAGVAVGWVLAEAPRALARRCRGGLGSLSSRCSPGPRAGRARPAARRAHGPAPRARRGRTRSACSRRRSTPSAATSTSATAASRSRTSST